MTANIITHIIHEETNLFIYTRCYKYVIQVTNKNSINGKFVVPDIMGRELLSIETFSSIAQDTDYEKNFFIWTDLTEKSCAIIKYRSKMSLNDAIFRVYQEKLNL